MKFCVLQLIKKPKFPFVSNQLKICVQQPIYKKSKRLLYDFLCRWCHWCVVSWRRNVVAFGFKRAEDLRVRQIFNLNYCAVIMPIAKAWIKCTNRPTRHNTKADPYSLFFPLQTLPCYLFFFFFNKNIHQFMEGDLNYYKIL